MNFNISLPGLEEFIITKTVEADGLYQLHMELERQPHCCPECYTVTNRVHDYRVQKIQHVQA
ncbi:transposase, partial [Filobacillus milosensis]